MFVFDTFWITNTCMTLARYILDTRAVSDFKNLKNCVLEPCWLLKKFLTLCSGVSLKQTYKDIHDIRGTLKCKLMLTCERLPRVALSEILG